jgi:fatty acid desaturase
MEEKKLNIEEVEIENQETPDLLNQEMNQEMDQEAQAQVLMSLASDPKILKAYRSIRSDIYMYGIGERRSVSKKERQKKKAKRRMAKKSKR